MTDVPVLLTGETGTGKEVFAQAIHYNSKRGKQNFVAVNCSSFSKELLESEMFGHRAGSFTGALKDKKGLLKKPIMVLFFWMRLEKWLLNCRRNYSVFLKPVNI